MIWIYLIAYFFAIVVLPRILYKIYPTLRGKFAEKTVKKELEKLSIDEYKVLNDVMLKVDDETCQIDHLIISKYGIFVIETKGYYGVITGDQYKDNWTQKMYGKKKKQINNPIRQNYFHIKILEKVLDMDENKFIPIICFLCTSKLRIRTKNANVLFYTGIKNFILNKKDVIILDDMDNIYNKIKDNNIIDKNIRKNHIKEIKKKKIKVENLINSNICPKCGSTLTVRNGKYGYFIGCSNYPNCKYIVRKQ